MQYPSNTFLRQLCEKYGTDDISYHRELDKVVGALFGINWYRIILDEGHAIKNVDSRSTLQFIVVQSRVMLICFSFHHQRANPAVHF